LSTEIILAGLSVVQGAAGGEGWSADQATYPEELDRIDPDMGLYELTMGFATFEYDINQIFGEDYTRALIRYELVGNFSYSEEEVNEKNRVMANCYVRLADWEADSRYFDHFSMTADVLDTPLGPVEDPKIQWHVHGRFDPASFGDVNYDVLLNLDQYGRLVPANDPVLDNNGWMSSAYFADVDSGFHLVLRQS